MRGMMILLELSLPVEGFAFVVDGVSFAVRSGLRRL
jgi:hypothetical protein